MTSIKILLGAMALCALATSSTASTVSLKDVKSAQKAFIVCLQSRAFGSMNLGHMSRCPELNEQHKALKAQFDLEQAQRRAIWSDYVEALQPYADGLKPIFLTPYSGSTTIKSHGLIADASRYTNYEFVAYHLPDIDGSVAEGQPRFRVWHTNAVGRNRNKVWYEGSGTRHVPDENFRRLKIGSNTEFMVVFMTATEGGGVRYDPGCYPAPTDYDQAWEQGC